MLVSFGLDHRRARLEVRERFHLEDEDVPKLYAALAAQGAEEVVVARTCNRVEVYCWWTDPAASLDARAQGIAEAWAGAPGPEAEKLLACAKIRIGEDTARHLLRVAAGLESQILGDIHILGQLRRAFREAVAGRAVGAHLHRLFENAFRIGKQVKRETQLMATRSGVGSEAARHAAVHLDGLAGRRCVVVGCGKIGAQAARSLLARGADDITLVNRSAARAEKLARDLGTTEVASFERLYPLLGSADVAIVATGASEPIVQRERLVRVRRAAGGVSVPRDLLVIDVSVPRNVDPAIGALAGAKLVDLDTLHPEAVEVERSRHAAVPAAEAHVEQGVVEIMHWFELHSARRALRPLRETLTAICRREVAYLAGEPSVAERAADRIVSRLMAHPMTALRAASKRGEAVDDAAGALQILFSQPGSAGSA